MKKICVSLLMLLLIPLTGISESAPMSDFEACVYHLERVQTALNSEWKFKELIDICDEIIHEGFIFIEREDQRDIHIYIMNINDTIIINNTIYN